MTYDITVQEIKHLPEGIFRVAIVDRESGEVISEHTIRVEELYLRSLGWDAAQVFELLRASMQFLLKREAASEILKEFNLQLIALYLPE